MSKAGKGQFIGHSPGIHSIQEKDDIFEADQVNNELNKGKQGSDFGQMMNGFGKLTVLFCLCILAFEVINKFITYTYFVCHR